MDERSMDEKVAAFFKKYKQVLSQPEIGFRENNIQHIILLTAEEAEAVSARLATYADRTAFRYDFKQLKEAANLDRLNQGEPSPKRPCQANTVQMGLLEFFEMAVLPPPFEITKDLPLAQLIRYIKSDLDSPIPLSSVEYDRIVASTLGLVHDKFFQKNFTRNEQKCLIISHILITALIETPNFEGSEANQQSQYDTTFANIIKQFISVMQSLRIYRNVHETESDCTDSSTKPDFLLYFLYILIMWGEEKTIANGGLTAANQALVQKLGFMSALYYGDIPYLFAYSACNRCFQMYAISRHASEPWHLLFELSLENALDRAKLIIYTFKLLRFIQLYTPLINKIVLNKGHPSRMPGSIQRSQGCVIHFWPLDGAFVKTVTDMQSRSTELADVYELQSIYQALSEKHTGIIRCTKFKLLRDGGYSVTMKPLCMASKLIDDPLELINCFKQLAKGLCYLKSKKILHRDLRWNNVVHDKSTESYMIIDFEHAALKKDQPVIVSSTFRSNLPTCFMKKVGDKYEYDYSTEVVSFGQMIDHVLKINDSYSTLYQRLAIHTNAIKDSVEFLFLGILRDLILSEEKCPNAEQLFNILTKAHRIFAEYNQNSKSEMRSVVDKMSQIESILKEEIQD